jgi:hypothetical protein
VEAVGAMCEFSRNFGNSADRVTFVLSTQEDV